MKKIYTTAMIAGLLMAFPSCKDNADKDAEQSEKMHSHDGGEMHSHDDDENNHDHDGDHNESKMMETLIVSMGSKSGSNVTGTINLTQEEDTVTMTADLKGLSTGSHAIHIHQNGDCSSDDGKSAGGHWNPTEEDHGKWGANMHHSGDIGNLQADADGNAKLTFSTDKWCLVCEDETKNIMGKAFIVHAKADDFESQPSGAAGARVACGVIEK
ncbi:MAG: superoxide dismutase family protein [Nonlabens sp.]